jgi:type IV pilus assembly protein PilX
MKTHHMPRQQRGASLLIALIFLVMMAMLGVTVANVTNLEERMAGNTRDRDLALQAAEAALRDAERRLSVEAYRAGPWPAWDATRANDAQFWEECFADNTAPCAAPQDMEVELPSGTDPGALDTQPQFVIETKPDSGTTKVFRVTARAVGGSPDTIVVLQAEFGHTPP